jgi:hypothetical protein
MATKSKSPKRFFKAMEKLAIVIEQIDLLRDDIRDGTISQIEVQELLDTISHNISVVEDDLLKHETDFIKHSEKK